MARQLRRDAGVAGVAAKGPRIPPLRRPRSRWRSPKHVFFGQKRLLWQFLLLGFRTFPRTKYQQITVHSLSMIRTQYEEINLFATRDTWNFRSAYRTEPSFSSR